MKNSLPQSQPTCQFCDRPPVGHTEPPLCDKHLDLAVFAEHLAEKQQPVTVETVTRLLDRCRANKGILAITPAEVPALLAGPFAQRYAPC